MSKRLRPTFSRRATTGTESSTPTSSPPLSNPKASPRGEYDPLDRAGARINPAAKVTASTPSSSNMAKVSSSGSQATVSPPAGLSASSSYSQTPLATSSLPAPPRLEDPLLLIQSLLPLTLQLLSLLGPLQLFSPPLVFPVLDHLSASPLATSETPSPPAASTSTGASNNVPHSSSASTKSTATSTSLPPRPPSPSKAPSTFSSELYAPSTISIPAVCAASVWRAFRGIEWISQAGRGEESDVKEEERTFDFLICVQGAMDVLGGEAASKGIEVIIGRAGSGTGGTSELLVRDDERKWSVIMLWVVFTIISSIPPGSTLEGYFNSKVHNESDVPVTKNSHDTILPTRASIDKIYALTIEFVATAPHHTEESADTPKAPPFHSPRDKSIMEFFGISLTSNESSDTERSWTLELRIPAARPQIPPIEDPSTLLGRRRASLEASGLEPTFEDLRRFAESGLKGTRVSLYAAEQKIFAKHITSYLADWAMDVSHIPLDRDDSDAASTTGSISGETVWNKGKREAVGRIDSGFGGSPGSESGSPLSPAEKLPPLPAEPVSSSSSSVHGADPPSNLIIIDDDIPTLRRLLVQIKTQLAPAPTNLSQLKRPQLASRRTRSSPHVRQLHQLPPAPPAGTWVIVHFASLTHYKTIREIVQDTLASCRGPTLPEILVVPKPAAPRRILTALWTALRRPIVDPLLAPIATSPSSPGIQYWTPRLSPAVTGTQDFDTAAGEALAKSEGGGSVNGGRPRTPPVFWPQPSSAAHHPPSPLGKISDDQVSYFSGVAETMDGTTPSEGMVIQSPDGRPAIFFQPQKSSRNVSGGKDKLVSRPMERERDVVEEGEDGDGDDDSPGLPAVAAPHEIGLGQGRRTSASLQGSDEPSPVPIGTPALTLDSFIAKSRGSPDVGSPTDDVAALPKVADLPAPLSRSQSSASAVSKAHSSHSGRASSSGSPRVIPASPRQFSTPPLSPRSDVLAASPVVAQAVSPNPSMWTHSESPPIPPSNSRRGSGSKTARRSKARKASAPTVPPINVLIVEDNPINQTILSMFMKKKGIKYAVAKDGEEAVQKWKKGSFHLVLMDIQLPVKDGIEATREIREMERQSNIGTFITTPTSDISSPTSSASNISSPLSLPGSPLLTMPVIIVALTASSLQADRVNALAAGCNDFLTKPVSLPWLQQKLLEWGSMAYLSGFSRHEVSSPSGAPSARPATASHVPTFSAGLNSKAADVISAHLHINPRPHSRSASPNRPPLPGHAAPPALTFSSPSPVLTPQPQPQPQAKEPEGTVAPPASTGVVEEVVPAEEAASEPVNLDAVDSKLEDLKRSASARRRPGPSPLSSLNQQASGSGEEAASLESIVAEGARLVEVGRSRANSSTNESFSQVMQDVSGGPSARNSPNASSSTLE